MTHTIPKSRVASPTLHATAFFSMAVFVAIIAMAYLFKVEIVAKGQGKVIPVGRVQVVQPEFGGQVVAIHVEDGEKVRQGQLLIALDGTNDTAIVNTLRAEQLRLEIEARRIEAVVALLPDARDLNSAIIGAAVEKFVQSRPPQATGFFEEQQRLLAAELVQLRDTLSQIEAQAEAGRRSQDVTRAGIERIDSALITQKERLETTQALLDKGTASRAVFLNVLDEFTDLEREQQILQQELSQKEAQQAAYENEKTSTISALRSRLLSRKSEVRGRLFELEEELVSSQRRLTNTTLLSPVDGVIDQLSVFTIGGVVDAGEELMRVVPADQAYEIEAVFPNRDIGFLKAGQEVNIKLDAFPAERFGALPGSIRYVSADARENEDGSFGFQVRIVPETPYLSTLSGDYPLQPGMTAVVDAITGERRILSYFFAPLVKVVQNSLGER